MSAPFPKAACGWWTDCDTPPIRSFETWSSPFRSSTGERNVWIDFEGIDGSGKTTVSVRLARRLRTLGFKVFHAREQGEYRSRLIQGIRALTRDAESILIAPETELLLNAAREAQLLSEEIRPALARGEIVLTDRGLHAHHAVAQYVRGLGEEGPRSVTEFAAG